MILVTTPQEQQASRLITEGLSKGLLVSLIIEKFDSLFLDLFFFKISLIEKTCVNNT